MRPIKDRDDDEKLTMRKYGFEDKSAAILAPHLNGTASSMEMRPLSDSYNPLK
jgi:hypothetical protein